MDAPALRNYRLDLALFLAFLVVFVSGEHGSTLHDAASVGLGGLALVHLLWHRRWILGLPRLLAARGAARAKLDLAVDGLLLLVMGAAGISGLGISGWFFESPDPGWVGFHHAVVHVVVLPVIIHVVLHLGWLVRTTRRLVQRGETGAPGTRAAP